MSSSSSSKSSKNRRSSILKVRQTTVDTKVDVVEQPKNRRRVSFHHQKTIKEYDKEKHELSATSPLKEAVKEAMSDFDSTKSNSTMMSLGTPDRTTGDNQTMMLFRGMMSGGPSSVHQETKDMSFSIIEEPTSCDGEDDTLDVFNGLHTSHMSVHSKRVDISYRMEETINENDADNTMDVFAKPSVNQSTRTSSNMTMDMDISKMDNTLTDGVYDEDETMAIFGTACKNKDTTIQLDNTMDVFTARVESCDKSRMSQSILMDVSANPSPASSQDRTMAVFGIGSQTDESVAMEEVTMEEEEDLKEKEEKKEEREEKEEREREEKEKEEREEKEEKEKEETPLSTTPIDTSITTAKDMNESQSPCLEDTMAIFGFDKTKESGEEDVSMDMCVTAGPPSQNEVLSPTMNMFKRKGEGEMESDETMDIFGSKRWREDDDVSVGDTVEKDGSEEGKESRESPEKSASIEVTETTLNGSVVKMEETTVNTSMVKSEVMEEVKEEEEEEEVKKRDESIVEISTKTAVEGSGDKSARTHSNEDRTLDVFSGLGDTSQMDLTGNGNGTFDVLQSGGDSSQMDMSEERDETMGVFGGKEEEEEKTLETKETKEEEDRKDDGEDKDEEKGETTIRETQATNQSIVEDHTIPSENGSEDMMEVTPHSQSPLNGERRKTRLSTVIEVSSRYTAASSQSMRQRVESTEEESKDEGILDRIEDVVDEREGKLSETEGEEIEEGNMDEEKIEEDKSVRMEEMEDDSMVDSPSPSGNNTTFSTTFTKRSMLDETRLSDRSMMNVTKTFDELVLEKIEWMRRERGEGAEMDRILREHASPFIEETDLAIHKSEASVEDLLSQITQSGNGDLLTKSIMKLNSSKVGEYRLLFEWARREAQREWWEIRAEKAERVNEEMKRGMKEDEEELEKAKDDLIMMNKMNELKEDVESMEREVAVGRGLSRNTIDELIGASKKKEEEKERLEREVTRMELECMKQSTLALKMMAERCNAVDESIKRKMEEREKNKRELRAYLSQLTNNLK